MGEVGEIVGGGTPSTDVEEYWNGNIPWISSSDVSENSIFDINKTRFINHNTVEKTATKLVPKETILIVSRVGIGKFAIADEDLCTSQDFSNLITSQNSYFLGYYFQSKRNVFSSLSQGTSIKGFTTKDLKSVRFSFPTLSEQTKIANFLSKLDERIKAQRSTIKEMEQLIQSLNDDLYKEYGNEIEISLSDLGKSYSGLSGKTAVDFGEGKPYISYKNIFKNNIVDESTFEYVNIKLDEKQNKVKYGDALFTISSETPEEVGMCAVYFGNEQELYLNSFCFGYRLNNNETLIPEYLPYLFSSSAFRRFIYPFAQGSTRYNLLKSSLMSAKFTIPKIRNQKRIVNLLSSLSQKLKTEQKLLSAYEQQKKYFLQNLFV